MAIRGFSINISEQLTSNTAQVLAQWIGGANVVRNAKIREYQALLSKGKGDSIGQAYSHIRKDKDLAFLKLLPVQIARNAASMVFADVTASRKGLRKFPKIKNKHKKRSVVITSELFMLEALPDGRTQFSLFSHAKKGVKNFCL